MLQVAQNVRVEPAKKYGFSLTTRPMEKPERSKNLNRSMKMVGTIKRNVRLMMAIDNPISS